MDSYKRYWLMNLFSLALHMTLNKRAEADVWRNFFKVRCKMLGPSLTDKSQGYAREALSDFDDSWNEFLKYAPDHILVFITHACCMLLKLR